MSDNKNISRRILEEVFSNGRMDMLEQVVSPNYVTHDPAAPIGTRGPQAVRQLATMYRGAFPDLRMTLEEQIGEGDRVVTRWTARGTHKGPYMGKAPTNKSAVVSGITIDRYENGKVIETWTNWDAAGLMMQLGLTDVKSSGADGEREQRAHR